MLNVKVLKVVTVAMIARTVFLVSQSSPMCPSSTFGRSLELSSVTSASFTVPPNLSSIRCKHDFAYLFICPSHTVYNYSQSSIYVKTWGVSS